MANITVTIDEDAVREALIALRDRRHTIRQELAAARAEGRTQIMLICMRQRDRLDAAGAALARAVGEAF